jgi:hypothetical protein
MGYQELVLGAARFPTIRGGHLRLPVLPLKIPSPGWERARVRGIKKDRPPCLFSWSRTLQLPCLIVISVLYSLLRKKWRFAPQTRTTVRPGQRGAKKFLSHYGDRLVWVRYRQDARRQRRFKTVAGIDCRGMALDAAPSSSEKGKPGFGKGGLPRKGDPPTNHRRRRSLESRQASLGTPV